MVSTIMVTMQHLSKNIPDVRENSSCESDIDRQELIDNYGSEKYLSKWNLDLEDVDHNESGGVTAGDFLHQQHIDHKQSESELHCLTIDDDDGDDDASLVSYNSVRDAGVPGKNTASYLPYQIQPLAQNMTLWQGYGGNIYFDPLRCQSMRINSSRPLRKKHKDSKSHRKTKSCSPSMEIAKHYIPSGVSSFHSLGSLRFSSRAEKRRNTSYISHDGRLRKGYSECKIQEPNPCSSTSNHRVRCESALESLIISGRQHKDVTSDPTEHVFNHDIKIRSTVKSKDNFPSLVLGQKFDTERGRYNRDNLPPVGTVAPGKDVAEPKPVFIIPFGALDDPVEGNNSSNNKPVGETSSKTNDTIAKKTKVNNLAMLSDSHVIAHAKHCNESELALSIVVVRDKTTAQQAGMTGNVSNRARREISDASLSDYLQAVPTPLSKEKKRIPKLSYTKRAMEMDPGSLSMNSMTESDLRISSTTALYGGYLPSTRNADNRLFCAERNSASYTGETNSLESLDERSLLSTKPRKRNRTRKVSPSKHCQDGDKCHLPIIGWHVS